MINKDRSNELRAIVAHKQSKDFGIVYGEATSTAIGLYTLEVLLQILGILEDQFEKPSQDPGVEKEREK